MNHRIHVERMLTNPNNLEIKLLNWLGYWMYFRLEPKNHTSGAPEVCTSAIRLLNLCGYYIYFANSFLGRGASPPDLALPRPSSTLRGWRRPGVAILRGVFSRVLSGVAISRGVFAHCIHWMRYYWTHFLGKHVWWRGISSWALDVTSNQVTKCLGYKLYLVTKLISGRLIPYCKTAYSRLGPNSFK